MTEDVKQWLAEIKLLQQKVMDVQQERDEAYASAANWRQLYETEARQRRTEVHIARQTIDELRQEIEELQAFPEPEGSDPEALALIQQQIASLEDDAALRAALVQARYQCDRLAQALKAEQAAHEQTRQRLTTALGDTMDLLTGRSALQTSPPATGPSDSGKRASGPSASEASAPPTKLSPGTKPLRNTNGRGGAEGSKSPLLELPPLDSAQCQS